MNNTILIVEDEEDILDLMEYTLLREGYDVITCIDTSNVKDGEKMIEESREMDLEQGQEKVGSDPD